MIFNRNIDIEHDYMILFTTFVLFYAIIYYNFNFENEKIFFYLTLIFIFFSFELINFITKIHPLKLFFFFFYFF
jgi:hypothetical protein